MAPAVYTYLETHSAYADVGTPRWSQEFTAVVGQGAGWGLGGEDWSELGLCTLPLAWVLFLLFFLEGEYCGRSALSQSRSPPGTPGQV